MKQSNLYCILADTGLGLHNSGRCYLCCHSRTYLKDDNGQEIYLDSSTLQDAWNSPTRVEIQHALNNNIEHPNCTACWEDEHAGKQSRRNHFNKSWGHLTARADQPQILDLKMGNTCNMKCRTCNPEVSSQWYREDWELNAGPKENISYPDYLKRWRRITASYNDDNTNVWETLKSWLPNTQYIDFYGAEPMLIKKNFEVLQAAVDQGTAQDITLHINTNGTIWEDYHEQLLKNFKTVFIDLSIDDVEDRCGYIRYSSTWDLVSGNIQKFIDTKTRNDNFIFTICVTINALNIYYIDEIFDYFVTNIKIPCVDTQLVPWVHSPDKLSFEDWLRVPGPGHVQPAVWINQDGTKWLHLPDKLNFSDWLINNTEKNLLFQSAGKEFDAWLEANPTLRPQEFVGLASTIYSEWIEYANAVPESNDLEYATTREKQWRLDPDTSDLFGTWVEYANAVPSIDSTKTTTTGMMINCNMLHLPSHLSIKMLPQEIKQIITQKLLAYKPTVTQRDKHKWQDQCDMILSFLNSDIDNDPGNNAAYLKEFHYYTRGLDRSRDQTFETVLPEFAALIKPWFEPLDRLLLVDSSVSK